MTQPSATSRPAAGWSRFILALAAFGAFKILPFGVAFAPIGDSFAIVAATMIACVIVAMGSGYRPNSTSLLVCAAGLIVLALSGGVARDQRLLVVGWSICLAGSFGVVSLIARARPFLYRALLAIAIAMLVALTAAASFGGGMARVRSVVFADASRRMELLDSNTEAWFAGREWRAAESRDERLTSFRTMYEELIHSLPERTVALLPSFLALQSLAGLALGVVLFQRTARAFVGPPLGRLKDFRFNDQFVWALAVALTILVLPEFAEGRVAAVNLLIFAGGLFALRGMGVIASLARPRAALAMLAILTAFAWPFALALTLLLGLADIWLDVRRRARPAA